MKILLDTPILLWALANDARLPDASRRMIEDGKNEIFYSILSLWEVQRIHLDRKGPPVPDAETLAGYCEEAGYRRLELTGTQVNGADSLFFSGGNGCRRELLLWMMASQAVEEDMMFLSADPAAAAAEEPRICYTEEKRQAQGAGL